MSNKLQIGLLACLIFGISTPIGAEEYGLAIHSEPLGSERFVYNQNWSYAHELFSLGVFIRQDESFIKAGVIWDKTDVENIPMAVGAVVKAEIKIDRALVVGYRLRSYWNDGREKPIYALSNQTHEVYVDFDVPIWRRTP